MLVKHFILLVVMLVSRGTSMWPTVCAGMILDMNSTASVGNPCCGTRSFYVFQ